MKEEVKQVLLSIAKDTSVDPHQRISASVALAGILHGEEIVAKSKQE